MITLAIVIMCLLVTALVIGFTNSINNEFDPKHPSSNYTDDNQYFSELQFDDRIVTDSEEIDGEYCYYNEEEYYDE